MVLISSYLLGQEYITQKFCVNKEKPELKCNGKCHLKDAIAQSSNQTDEKNSHLTVEILFSIFYMDFGEEVKIDDAYIKSYGALNKKLTSNFNHFFFHPPPIVSFT